MNRADVICRDCTVVPRGCVVSLFDWHACCVDLMLLGVSCGAMALWLLLARAHSFIFDVDVVMPSCCLRFR